MLIRQDIVCGGGFIGVGLLTIGIAYQYDFGLMTSPGPGAFPALLGIVLLGCGIAIVLPGLRQQSITVDIAWRGIAFVCIGMLSFIFGIKYLGLIPACFISAFLVSLAHPKNKMFDTLLISIGITTVIVTIFYGILRQPYSLFGGL